MNKSKKRAGKAMQILKKVWRVGRWVLLAIVGIVVAFVVINGIIYYPSIQALENIKNTQLTMADVTGETLPAKRTDSEYTATLIGLDENANGIRDDVEHAIFAMIDDTLQMRAAKLQYAQALHLYFTDVRDGDTLIRAVDKISYGRNCVYDQTNKNMSIYERSLVEREHLKSINDIELNTEERLKHKEQAEWIRTGVYDTVEDEGCHVIVSE